MLIISRQLRVWLGKVNVKINEFNKLQRGKEGLKANMKWKGTFVKILGKERKEEGKKRNGSRLKWYRNKNKK